MTAAQLALVEVPATPKLTPRQTRALEHVRAAGTAGIHADELGAILHAEYRKHSSEGRCRWCGATGQDILKALKAKGLVRYRRGSGYLPGAWLAVDAQDAKPSGMLPADQALPF